MALEVILSRRHSKGLTVGPSSSSSCHPQVSVFIPARSLTRPLSLPRIVDRPYKDPRFTSSQPKNLFESKGHYCIQTKNIGRKYENEMYSDLSVYLCHLRRPWVEFSTWLMPFSWVYQNRQNRRHP